MAIFDFDEFYNEEIERIKSNKLIQPMETHICILNHERKYTNNVPDKLSLHIEAYIGLLNSKREYTKSVFISHKTSNKPKATLLAEYLNNNEFDVYLDVEDRLLQYLIQINFPKSLDNIEIMKLLKFGITNSDYFICLLSSNIENNSEDKNWVKDEVSFANQQNKNICGLKVEQCKTPSFFTQFPILYGKKEFKNHFGVYISLNDSEKYLNQFFTGGPYEI